MLRTSFTSVHWLGLFSVIQQHICTWFTLKITLHVKWYTASDDKHVRLPQSFKIRSSSHWICQLTGRRWKLSEFRHSSIFPVLSRSTALLSITYKEGAQRRKEGEIWQTKTTSYWLGMLVRHTPNSQSTSMQGPPKHTDNPQILLTIHLLRPSWQPETTKTENKHAHVSQSRLHRSKVHIPWSIILSITNESPLVRDPTTNYHLWVFFASFDFLR